MPVIDVTLVAPHSGEAIGPETALVDSGADGTLVPVDLLEQIGAVSIATARLRWLWGESQPVNIYIVQLEIGSYIFPKVRVAGVPTDIDFILGRDVLNWMVLTLNGPARAAEIPA
jgi:predicted aspartyl protease